MAPITRININSIRKNKCDVANECMKEKIKILSEKYLPEVIQIRRHLHANPELSFEEYNTSKFIAAKLKEFGIPFQEGIVKTGIVNTVNQNEVG
mgnify:CR=1 FL=1